MFSRLLKILDYVQLGSKSNDTRRHRDLLFRNFLFLNPNFVD